MVFSTIRKIKEILTKLGYQKIKWNAVSYSWVCGNESAVLLEAVNEEKEKILKELK